jgi:hypothetical protein
MTKKIVSYVCRWTRTQPRNDDATRLYKWMGIVPMIGRSARRRVCVIPGLCPRRRSLTTLLGMRHAEESLYVMLGSRQRVR